MNRAIRTFVILLLASVSAFATVHRIGTESALRNFSSCAKKDTVLLTGDINITQDFSPLCKNGFYGVFDGQGHKISNLTISKDPVAWLFNENPYTNIAFISVLGEGGVLKNLTFVNPSVNAYNIIMNVKDVSVAVAVGELRGGSVENVHVNGGSVTVTSQYGYNLTADAGGLVGTAYLGVISDSDANITVTNSGSKNGNAGGICGNVMGDVTLNSVTYTGNADALIGAGGNNVTSVDKYGAITVKEKGGVKTAVIDGDYMGTDSVEIPGDGITVSSVTLSRTFIGNVISTLYLPFDIAVSDIEGAKVYKFKTVEKGDDGRWKFKVSTADTVKANTPYIVMPSGSSVTFNIAESVTLNTEKQGDNTTSGRWAFRGTYVYKTFSETDDEAFYVFAAQNIGGTKLGEFVKSSGYANPMRAYLSYRKTLAKSASGSLGGSLLLPDELDLEIENDNGIVVQTGTLNTFTGEVRMDRWFDMKGRRLNSKPTVKGVYYKNGKKAIIR